MYSRICSQWFRPAGDTRRFPWINVNVGKVGSNVFPSTIKFRQHMLVRLSHWKAYLLYSLAFTKSHSRNDSAFLFKLVDGVLHLFEHIFPTNIVFGKSQGTALPRQYITLICILRVTPIGVGTR